MAGLVRIDFSGAIQGFPGPAILACRIVKLKQFGQRPAILVLAIGRIEELHQVFQELDGRHALIRNFRHQRDEFTPPARFAFVLLQLVSQGHGAADIRNIEINADKRGDLIYLQRIAFQQLPRIRLRFRRTPGSHQRPCI